MALVVVRLQEEDIQGPFTQADLMLPALTSTVTHSLHWTMSQAFARLVSSQMALSSPWCIFQV